MDELRKTTKKQQSGKPTGIVPETFQGNIRTGLPARLVHVAFVIEVKVKQVVE
jgi:hypothetical protein